MIMTILYKILIIFSICSVFMTIALSRLFTDAKRFDRKRINDFIKAMEVKG